MLYNQVSSFENALIIPIICEIFENKLPSCDESNSHRSVNHRWENLNDAIVNCIAYELSDLALIEALEFMEELDHVA